MSLMLVFLLISPFLALAVGLCLVWLAAIRRARPEDLPTVLAVFVSAFRPLVDRLPQRPEDRRGIIEPGDDSGRAE
ncbi:hypothetical protein [Dactylosporangium sp. CA-092794]|uniref:hypothetical protein n=1 Tax=Dactylosporangium sp. CA-092794 TaxID=3239929 RepID=UPI003D8C4453